MPPLATDLFDYPLPAHLIAQSPAARRDASRLLVVERGPRRLHHTTFAQLTDWLTPDDLLIRNTAAVLPARLQAVRPTGGAVECLLLRPVTDHAWWCLLRPGRRLPPGATFGLAGLFSATVREKRDDGTSLVDFTLPPGQTVVELANRHGAMPLPPYIERSKADPDQRRMDLHRYQTVYANPERQVAVAAPTAGLHFTPELLAALSARGVAFADVTLHVGLGTFRPITTPTVDEHAIHHEWYELPVETQRALRAAGRRRVAVGTTSVRAIEDHLHRTTEASDTPYLAEASLFLRPPATFQGVDALITNFHQPRSTLLCLVSAFLTPGRTEGIDWLKEIYAEAVAQEYRFFSYGDAMLIL